MSIRKAKAALTHKAKRQVIRARDMIGSGSTGMNLACTGRARSCFIPGKIYSICGDSGAGKTWLTLNIFAEAAQRTAFSEYRFIHDNIEDGALMDVTRFFGKRVNSRIEPPSGTRKNPIYSETVEDCYYNIDDACKAGIPFIYVIDSMDALDANDDNEKFEANKIAHRKGAKKAGTYGMAKAKLNSAYIRKVAANVRKSKSIVIIISQSRDNVGYGAKFKPKTRSGGTSLKFYATLEMWLSIAGHIHTTYKGNKVEQGMICKLRVTKNRIVGRDRVARIPIYHSYGIDDVGANIDYIIDNKHWAMKKGKIVAPEFNYIGKRDGLIKLVEDENRELELQMLTGEVFNEIEDACALKRKPRYE